MQLLRSMLFTGSYFLLTPLYGILMLLVSWAISYRMLWSIVHNWARVILWLLDTLCGLKFEVKGRDNIPAGAHVTLWKHSSTWETIAQTVVFPEQAWVMKRELMWIPIVGWALRLVEPIAINRSAGGSAIRQVVAQGRARLSAGRWVVIFPEGTRTAIGEQRKFGISGALLAIEAGVSIVPVAHTAGYFWPRRGWLKKPGVIQVIIGKPIATAGRDAREVTAEVQNWMEQTMAALLTT